ncbi:hypothetical protein MYX84_06925 [Acidobacteria bacterium AH-259-O06]|nr:hypothetical protein [Acidobacteria bacterium AH-259-O06]
MPLTGIAVILGSIVVANVVANNVVLLCGIFVPSRFWRLRDKTSILQTLAFEPVSTDNGGAIAAICNGGKEYAEDVVLC